MPASVRRGSVRKEAARKDADPRPRGRPARLSREQVIDAVMTLLARDPHAIPTIARIADEVGAVPAALYRHFESQDDLFDGVLARVLAANEFEVDARRPWEAQLADWMRGLRGHLLQYPAVFALMGRAGRTSPAWLDASSALVEILERAGLEGSALAGSYLWVLESTVGLVWQESVLPFPEQLANARASRPEISEVARTRFTAIAPFLDAIDGDDVFDFAISRMQDGVRQQLEGSTSGGAARSRATARPRARAATRASGSARGRARAKPRAR